MLKRYLRKLKQHLVVSIADPHGSHREWAVEAFRDFIATDRDRQELLTSCSVHAQRLAASFAEARADDAKSREFAELLLNVCAWIDNGKVWHKDLKYRSYVDVSLQTLVLRIFVDHLAASCDDVDPLEMTALLLAHVPDSRVALLVHADLLLEEGSVDAAIDNIRRALRIQAVCPSAQEALFRAYRAKREMGSDAEELKVLDYDLRERFCPLPFTHLSTGFQGSAYACSCPAWVPYPIGNVLEAESADAVWNSDVAQEIRRSILDGDFSYCSKMLCSLITGQKLPKKSEITDPIVRGYIETHATELVEVPRLVELNYDTTCNLACPSCRTEILVAKADEQDAYARAADRVILPLLKKVEGTVYLSGGGEAFSSRHYRSILSALNRVEYPGLSLYLISNGLLITPQRWSEFPTLPEMIGILSISIDAARAETYEELRRPGKWSTLMKNLEFIADMRRSGIIPSLSINFVVQKANYREILDFVALGDRMAADTIWLQRVVNYGAYDEATFAAIDVTMPEHPEHAQLLGILRNPILKSPRINMQMLIGLLPEVVATHERLEHLY